MPEDGVIVDLIAEALCRRELETQKAVCEDFQR